jgi:uncharacterized membrane protein YeaQ/YmgE (transglycosylase-associated protein family)
MGIIGWLLIGLIAGTVAKMITPQREPDSWLFSLGVGIAGSILGGFLAGIIGITAKSFLGSLAIALAGSVLVLYIYHRYITKQHNNDEV